MRNPLMLFLRGVAIVAISGCAGGAAPQQGQSPAASPVVIPTTRTWEGVVTSGAFPAGRPAVGTISGEMEFRTVAILRNCERLTRDDFNPTGLEELTWTETAPWTLRLDAAHRGAGSVTTSEGNLSLAVGL